MAYPTYYTGQPQAQPVPVVYGYQPTPPQGQLEQLRAAQAYQAQPVIQTPAPSPQQTSGTGIPWVQGEAGAKAYLVAPGGSVLLMDSEAQSFYIKSADGSGMPLPLRIFDYTERQAQTQTIPPTAQAHQPAPAANYATREELETLARRLEELEQVRTNTKPAEEPARTEKGGNGNGKRNLPTA